MVYFTLGYTMINGHTINVDIPLEDENDSKWKLTYLREHINQYMPPGFHMLGAICNGVNLTNVDETPDKISSVPYPNASDPTFIRIPIRPNGQIQNRQIQVAGRKRKRKSKTKRKRSKRRRRNSKRRRRSSKTHRR